METLLSRFQSDISNIGIEIKHLQDECLGKEMKIKNRQVFFKLKSFFF